ncbi:MAG: hypothetical protein ACREUU_21045 [Gammaproteobacteria bacterium]
MPENTRRDFLQKTLGVLGLTAAGAVVAGRTNPAGAAQGGAAADGNFLTLTAAAKPHDSVRIIDTETMPWPEPDKEYGWKVKTLFRNEQTGDHLIIIQVAIGAPGGRIHYHNFHEWAYWLSGDFTNNEYTHPQQQLGDFQQFREGIFLDRPAFSLHGGEPDRLDSQVGGTCLIMEEGGKTLYVRPDHPKYSDDWKTVKQWAVPRLIDTLAEMPWEPYPEADGVLIKRLVDDQVRGFRARMWRLPAGWQSAQAPAFAGPYYYEQAHQFNFVLNGDVRIQAYSAPGRKAEAVRLGKSFYFERPPMSIFGLAEGQVSEEGCVWLEVTYGKGTAIHNVPIKAPTLAPA